MMFNKTNNINRANSIVMSVIMVAVMAAGGFEIFLPNNTQADFSVDNSIILASKPSAESNTIMQPKPVTAAHVVNKVRMTVTAYSSTVAQTDSTPFITASGKTVADGIVANNMLPFGTKIRIPDLYGDKVFVVQDRMNKRKGQYHLDIWMSTYNKAKNFGAEVAYIEVLQN